MEKCMEEIEERLRRKEAVVLTWHEASQMLEKAGGRPNRCQVDVVTVGTFAPVTRGGAFLNFSLPCPVQKIWLDNVPADATVPAVTAYLDAGAQGAKGKNGAGVITSLVAGNPIRVCGETAPVEWFAGEKVESGVCSEEVEEGVLSVEWDVEETGEHFCRLGAERSDIGSKVFLGGTIGCVVARRRDEKSGASPKNMQVTLAGDLRQMQEKYVQTVQGKDGSEYLAVGVGVAVPILDDSVLMKLMMWKNAAEQEETMPAVVGMNSCSQAGWQNASCRLYGSYHSAYPEDIAGTVKNWVLTGVINP